MDMCSVTLPVLAYFSRVYTLSIVIIAVNSASGKKMNSTSAFFVFTDFYKLVKTYSSEYDMISVQYRKNRLSWDVTIILAEQQIGICGDDER